MFENDENPSRTPIEEQVEEVNWNLDEIKILEGDIKLKDTDKGLSASGDDGSGVVNPEEEELDLDLTFLGKPTRLKKKEAKEVLQKGMNYDHIKQKAESAETELANLRREIAERELAEQKRKIIQELAEETGLDPDTLSTRIENHPEVRQAKKLLEERQREIERQKIEMKRMEIIAQQKESLKAAPYFAEIEKEADEIVKNNPQTDYLTAFDYLYGKALRTGKLDAMKSEVKKATEKSVIADFQDRQKRGYVGTSDSSSADSIDINKVLDRQAIELSNVFGNDPKDIAKYVKTHSKK